MENLLKDLLKQILRKHPDTVAVLIHGSAISGKLDNYSDIDFNIFVSGKPKMPIEDSIIDLNNKKILVNLNVENYKEALESVKNENKVEQILVNLIAFKKVRILYDKIGFIQKFKREAEKRAKNFRERYAWLLNIKYSILMDFFFKLQRAHKRKDIHNLVYAASTMASQCPRIIQFFNNLKPEQMYNSILSNYKAIYNFKNVPKHFKTDFEICMGLKPASINKIYNSGVRIAKEITEFLSKQNLKEIKNREFFELLEQSKRLFGKI